MNWKIGVIGFGNMAQAMIGGWIKSGTIDRNDVYVCAAHYDKLCKSAEKYGVTPCQSIAEVCEKSDMILLAIKPYQMEKVIPEVKEMLKDKVVVSVVSSWMFDRMETVLCEGTHHISTCPNTPVAVCEGIIIVQDKHSLSDEENTTMMNLFSQIALVEVMDEQHIGIGGTLSGATPAYAAMFIEALGDAGVKHGLTRAQAYRLAAKMIQGTGKLYLEEGHHPGAMKDAVCSPGGITITGVETLERNGFRFAVMDAINACQAKKM